jgi:hypothetical protein
VPLRLVLCFVACATLAHAATALAADVYPVPGSKYEMPDTQIAFRGIPASQLGSISVVGSKSGPHTGTVEADSDGAGGSWLPSKPFVAGETVRVSTGLDLTGAPQGTFSFQIAHFGHPFGAEKIPVAPAGTNGVQHFVSRADLTPASLKVSQDTAPASDGDIFVAPQFGPTENGPMILNSAGQLVWFHPVSLKENQLATDFRTQLLYGQPVLTWFQGTTGSGLGQGEGIVFNQQYQLQQVVKAADGLQMDLHEFLVTNTGQAYIIAVEPVWLPGVHRPVADGVVQEIDMKTGLLLWEWNALDHIPLSESLIYGPNVPGHIEDPYHLNSVSLTSDGNLLISSRNTSSVYKVDRDTGSVMWTLGGKRSSFKMGSGTSFALQHDAVAQPDGTITLFDDGAGPPRIHSASRAIRLSLNDYTMTATLVRQYTHSPSLLADFEGGEQLLGDGDVFIGWGQQPYISGFDSSGRQDFDAHFVSPTASYRAYRFQWTGSPPTNPAIGLRTSDNGTRTLYASWNGATDVSSWRALAGNSPGTLSAIATSPSKGFETAIAFTSGDSQYRLQALGSAGQVLATSAIAGAGPHVAIYGNSAFVSGSGGGALPVGCFAPKPCRIVATVSNGTTVLARSGAQSIGANQTGLVYYQLSGGARSALAKAHHMSVTTSVLDQVSHTTATVPDTLIAYSTSGSGPTRASSPVGPLSLLGRTDFVASGGSGGVLTSCSAATQCRAAMQLSSGGTVIASTGAETEGPRSAGYFSFQLNAAGEQMLAKAPGHQLGVSVAFGGSGIASTGTIALVPYS